MSTFLAKMALVTLRQRGKTVTLQIFNEEVRPHVLEIQGVMSFEAI